MGSSHGVGGRGRNLWISSAAEEKSEDVGLVIPRANHSPSPLHIAAVATITICTVIAIITAARHHIGTAVDAAQMGCSPRVILATSMVRPTLSGCSPFVAHSDIGAAAASPLSRCGTCVTAVYLLGASRLRCAWRSR